VNWFVGRRSSQELFPSSYAVRDFCGNLDTQVKPNLGAEITTEPRINDRIRTPQIRLINYTGEQVGVVDIEAALAMADEIGLDLVEIAPEATPPVCKIMDFGKYKYEIAQKAREARQNQTHMSRARFQALAASCRRCERDRFR